MIATGLLSACRPALRSQRATSSRRAPQRPAASRAARRSAVCFVGQELDHKKQTASADTILVTFTLQRQASPSATSPPPLPTATHSPLSG